MAGVSNTDLLDLIALTQDQHPWAPQFDHLQQFHTYEVVNRWLRGDRMEVQDGEQIVSDITYREQGTAKHVDLYEETAPSVINVSAQCKIRWTHAQAHYAYHRAELLMNLRGSRIINLQKARRLTALSDMADILEQRGWLAPPDITTTKYPYGIPYWHPPITGAQVTLNGGQSGRTTGAFQGYLPYAQDGTQFPTCGGLACSTTVYPRYASWNDTWENNDGSLSDVDMYRLGRMFRQLRFESPLAPEDLSTGRARMLRHYVNEKTLGFYEELARKSDDQVGADLAKYAEMTAYKRIPVRWVDQLDADTTNPWRMVNHNYFKAVVLRGNYFYEDRPQMMDNQPGVFVVWFTLTYGYTIQGDRRRSGGVISYVAAV